MGPRGPPGPSGAPVSSSTSPLAQLVIQVQIQAVSVWLHQVLLTHNMFCHFNRDHKVSKAPLERLESLVQL